MLPKIIYFCSKHKTPFPINLPEPPRLVQDFLAQPATLPPILRNK